MKISSFFRSFTPFEYALWIGSVCLVGVSFAFSAEDPLSFAASLVGVTALIFIAKGRVLGQVLTVVFSVLYGIVSFYSRYYGEMITYLGMSAPIALAAVFTWLKNPASSGEVRVNTLRAKDYAVLFSLGIAVTILFWFLLKALGTDRLLVSTLSVLTSFLAASLTLKRSEYYAIAYAVNDVVLIALWILASARDFGNLPMVACFLAFLANDIYGFVSWVKMKKRQAGESLRSEAG